MGRLLSVKELSEFLQVAEKTLYNWTSAGFIPYRKAGRLLRFDIDEVKKWLKKRGCSGTLKRVPEVKIDD